MAVFALVENDVKHFNSIKQICGYLDCQSESKLWVAVNFT